MKRAEDKGLGRAQKLVLAALAEGEKDVRTIAYDWPSLTEGTVRSAINSLGHRSLVDAVRFEGRSRLYGLTRKGAEVVEQIFGGDVEDPDEDVPWEIQARDKRPDDAHPGERIGGFL